ncbi:TPA: DUF2523 family protein [Aeromonas veronii]|uniref:DUF2523 family protein n=1 Tax=Aeromonas veronii TaxID=654 RepID=UPI0024442559|nr:DUF2523 family protein [Aeromonas veronii]
MSEFFNFLAQSVNDIHSFFVDGVPYIVSRTLAYIVEYGLYLKIQSEIMMIKIGLAVAQQIIQDLNISATLQPLLSSLPSGVRWFLAEFRILDGLNLVLHAIVARFTLNFLGW